MDIIHCLRLDDEVEHITENYFFTFMTECKSHLNIITTQIFLLNWFIAINRQLFLSMFAIFLCRVPRGEVIKSVPYSAARPLIVRRKKCHYYWQVIRLLKTFNIKKPSHRVLNKKLSSSEMPRRWLAHLVWFYQINYSFARLCRAAVWRGGCRLTWHQTAPAPSLVAGVVLSRSEPRGHTSYMLLYRVWRERRSDS